MASFIPAGGSGSSVRPVIAAGNTLADDETLDLQAGTNVTMTESNGVVTFNSTDTNTIRSIQVEGSAIPSNAALNMIGGTNVTLSASGGAVTFNASGGGGGGSSVPTPRDVRQPIDWRNSVASNRTLYHHLCHRFITRYGSSSSQYSASSLGSKVFWWHLEFPKDTVLNDSSNRFYVAVNYPTGVGSANPTNEIVIAFYNVGATTGLPGSIVDYHYITHSDGQTGNQLFEFGSSWNIDGSNKFEAGKTYICAFQHLSGDSNQKAWIKYANANSGDPVHNVNMTAAGITVNGNHYNPGPFLMAPSTLSDGAGGIATPFPEIGPRGYTQGVQGSVPALEVRYT